MSTTQATPTITDTRFNRLKAKLRELFELDKSDLDFGIYRIMAAKNKEVTDFLDRQLKDVVKQTLTEHGAGATDALQAELDETIKNLREAGLDDDQIDDAKKVKDLREKLSAAGGKTGEELEADIYNHLLAFFGRYYDEGDFISQRRYKGDTYAIPYSGEEVTLHWANKDQYYIKSGEWHKDYRFKLPDGRRVRFALVDATQETGNNKEPDEAKRRYILVDDNPVVAEGDTLTFRMHFKAPSEAEKERADDDAVAIFGGKYEKTTKGDERERFCADAEKRAIPHIPEAWAAAVLAESKTDAKPLRTILGKHLDAFTARNTFDYFIHKDLGGFLRRELDFYIKNEVVRLDDLDAAPAEHLQRVQGRVRAIRRVASKVIELLESLENFQKKLWLKKKFVLGTSWLVTVDRVPERLRETVVENAEQWAEWKRLGFKPEGDAGGLFGGAEWGTRAYLDACDKLVVDTRLFDEVFTAELLASETIQTGAQSLNDAVSGTLVNGDNFQALGTLVNQLSDQARFIYCDPPYNTGNDGFNYKDTLQHSSWMSMMTSRLSLLGQMMTDDGTLTISLDDYEIARAAGTLPPEAAAHFSTCIIWQKVDSPNDNKVSLTPDHEYILLLTRTPDLSNLNAMAAESILDAYKKDEESGRLYRDRLLKKNGANSLRADRPTMYYPVVDPDGNEILPLHDDGRDACWSLGKTAVQALEACGDLIWKRRTVAGTERWEPYTREYAPDDPTRPFPTIWDDVKTMRQAKAQLKELFGTEISFSTVKPIQLLEKLIAMGTNRCDLVIDPFAGSGTTGHATLVRNRTDDGHRRFVLVEMGSYFDAILRPRIAKTVFSPEWKAGRAQTHDQGCSALVKCFAVESYEDALNNLPTPTGDMFDGRPAAEADALIRYALDLEMGPHLLDLDIFRDPWGHAINAQRAGDDEIKRHRVDLVETFNYLLGLRVSAYGTIERYSAEFERAEHDDGLGRLKLTGRLRRDPEGPFKFQRVEGILNDGNDTRVLVVWRKLRETEAETDEAKALAAEQDAAVLDAWMARHREATTERTEHRDYHQIYINGPVTLPQPTAEIRTVWPIEEAFKRKMFEDTEGGA